MFKQLSTMAIVTVAAVGLTACSGNKSAETSASGTGREPNRCGRKGCAGGDDLS